MGGNEKNKKKMNIMVTGSNGQLGREIRCLAKKSHHSFVFTSRTCSPEFEYRQQLDITDRDAVSKFVSDNSIDVIVNCAAYTNVDDAEYNRDECFLTNFDALGYLADAANDNDALLIHISSDYVFSNSAMNEPIGDDEKTSPFGVYSVTKALGESLAKSANKHVILRTAWVYSTFGKNFCKTMMGLMSSKPSLSVVFDQTGTPTYAGDLANAVMTVVSDYSERGLGESSYENSGIYNYTNEGVCSWYDFAKMIQFYTGSVCDVTPIKSSELACKGINPNIRPKYSVLDKTRFKNVFGVTIPYWVDSLAKCVETLKCSEKN